MPNWTKEQELAINKEGTNIIVSAGAGSGKTAVLTERVIRKLKKGISIRNLLILTFTNNAAHEMKDRIKKAIKEAAKIDDVIKKEIDYIETANITTFDAFALSLVKKYHYKIGISKDISIIDSSIIDLKKEEFLDEIFENLYKEKNTSFLNLIDLLCTKDDKEVKKLIINISQKLDLLEDKANYLNKYIEKFYNTDYFNNIITDYEHIISLKVNYIKYLMNLLSYEMDSTRFSEYSDALEPLFKAKNYDDFKRSSLVELKPIKNATDYGKDLKKSISESIKEIHNMCYLTLDDIKKSLFSTKDYVQAIINIINTLDSKILEFKRQINKYEFTDISIMAINIVKNNEDIREELKNSFNEICIDEYQDTSDLQEIFINLISNNNVYMVGDIKQSIYRFRNANPMLFKEKYDLYSNSENGFKIDLNKNFRSRMEVLDDINLIFNRIMDNEIGGASYKESHNMIFGNSKYISDGYTNQNYNLEIYNYPYDKDSVFKNEEIEAFIIANDIKHKINEDYLIYDKDSQQLRKANFSDFVILMDRASAFDTYKKIFEYLNIPTTLYKDNNIVSENELLIIKNIIGLIIKINENNFDTDFIHMFMSISRSYIKKIDDDELFEIIKNSSYKETELYNICFKISQNIDNLTNSELFEIIVLKFDFINSFIKVGNIENKINIINYLQKTFEDLDSIGYGIYDLNNYLENIISNNKQINISMNIDNTNSVKIMTIHKSKGLEFPICYFSGFDKNFNLKDLNERILYNNKYGIITPYFNEGLNSLITKDIIKYNYIKDDISERIRLLYVALTRAKEKMIIVANINEDELHNTNNSIIDTYLRSKYRSFKDILLSLGDNLKKYISNIKLETLNITRDYNNIKNYNFADIINKTDNKIITTKINVQNDIVLNKHFSKNEKTIIDLKLKNNLEKGLYLHELFESTNFLEPDYSNINEEDSQYIKNFLNQDIMKNIKNATIYHEYEFLYEENNIKYHGIIDLLVIYDDYIDIIDYKLLNVISEDYIKQLNGYKSYIELEFNKNANIYLYSILNNTITKVQ